MGHVSAQRAGRWLAAFMLLALLAAQPARGGTGLKLALPTSGKPAAGLTLALDCDWAEGGGYRPARLVVTCMPPPKNDRTLNVVVTMSNWSRSQIQVVFDVEIPAGSPGVTKIVSLPHYTITPRVTFEVYEDGAKIDDLSQKNVGISGASYPSWNDMPAVLFVSPVDVGQFSFLSAAGATYGANLPPLLTSVAQVPSFVSVSPPMLVENWINYSSLDAIYISLSDAQALAATSPKVWQSICRWGRVGGNLLVYGAGHDWHGLATLEQLLQIPAAAGEVAGPMRDWNEPAKELYRESLQSAANSANKTAFALQPDDAADGQPQEGETPPAVSPFVWKDMMLGRVVAVASDDPLTTDKYMWRWAFNTLEQSRWSWSQRHGLAFHSDNTDFDNLLIADVGLPPVQMYRVLITVFVIAIGPLNYWLLYRSGRLPMLLFTVPAAALAISAALFGYALLGDGFQIRLRARSFTQLDQRTHEAACWSRLSYYAGLAPSGGMLFPADTAVFPLEKEINFYGSGSRPRAMRWEEDQHLTRGWLPSRTPTQYVTLRAYESRRELRVANDPARQACTIQNRLGARIQRLLLCDAAGELYSGEQVLPENTAQLTHLEGDATVERECGKMYEALRRDTPQIPPEASIGAGFVAFGSRRSYAYNVSAAADSTQSILESSIRQASLHAMSQELQPRSYIAIVDRPADVVVGVPDPVESQSLHVIVGHW